jgi:hypothetical protein
VLATLTEVRVDRSSSTEGEEPLRDALATLADTTEYRIPVDYGTTAAQPSFEAWLFSNVYQPNAAVITFRGLVDRWRRETKYVASPNERYGHPAYRRLIELGQPAVPLLLQELRDRPDFYFRALSAITGENPAFGTTDPESARARWLEWGRSREILGA